MSKARKEKRASTAANRKRSGPAAERRIREETLDQTLADSFPSSDPPSTIPNPSAEDEAA
jgi:hypothetical protein